MNKPRLLLLLLLVLSLHGKAQTYFNARYSNSNSGFQSFITNIIPLDTGGYIGFGQADNYPFPASKAIHLRWLDGQGRLVRQRYYGRPGHFFFSGFNAAAFQGGTAYLLAGSVNLPTGEQQATLWRFSAQGDSLWCRFYRNPDSTSWIGRSACRMPDGGFALVGYARVGLPPNISGDLLVVRTDSLGQALWHRYFSLGYNDDGYSVTATPDGGLLVGGTVTYQPGGTNSDPFVYKLDSLGNEEWHQTYGSTMPDGWGKVLMLADGNCLITTTLGQFRSGGRTQLRLLVEKRTLQSQLIWQRLLGPTRRATVVFAAHELADGNLVIAGQTVDTTNAPAGNAYPIGFATKLCAGGDSLWYRPYALLVGGQSHNYLRDFRPTADGGFVGSGFLFAYPPDTGSSDGWAFRVDSAGYLQAGGAPVTVTCGPVAAMPELIMNNEQLMVWPNPSLDGVFYLGRLTPQPARPRERGSLMVTDALGRQVWRGMWDGVAETVVDLSRQPPGLYLLRVVGLDGRVLTRKLVR